jgi:hypothetical protein
MQCIHLSPRQAFGSTVWIKRFDQILDGVAQLPKQ